MNETPQPDAPPHIVALRARLATCEAETAEWERVYAVAEAEMQARLAGYHSHHSEVLRLKQALVMLGSAPRELHGP